MCSDWAAGTASCYSSERDTKPESVRKDKERAFVCGHNISPSGGSHSQTLVLPKWTD